MAPSRRSRAYLCALVLHVLSSGCAVRRAARSPEEVVESFARALAKGRLERAYGLLSEAQHQTLSYDDFQKQIHQNEAEAKELSKSLRGPRHAQLRAFVELADGRRLALIQDRDGFKIDEPVAAFYSQATPRAALHSFVRAVEASRWDVLLALMPSADRAGLDPPQLARSLEPRVEELTRLAALLSTALEAPIEIVGERATLPYGESFTMRFVRESDGWKVEDPE